MQDAYFTFQEQADKNTPTSLLLNSQALCQINQGKYDEAQSIMQEALDKVSHIFFLNYRLKSNLDTRLAFLSIIDFHNIIISLFLAKRVFFHPICLYSDRSR